MRFNSIEGERERSGFPLDDSSSALAEFGFYSTFSRDPSVDHRRGRLIGIPRRKTLFISIIVISRSGSI